MITLQSGLTVSNRNFSMTLSHPSPSRVIITVPHDGLSPKDFFGTFQPRTSGVRNRDAHVWPIANNIVQKCLCSGVHVDAVRFLMARAFVDANREMPGEPNLDPDTLWQTAFDDPFLLSVYQNYRDELSRLVTRSIQAFGVEQVLFIDLHGFARQPKIAPSQGYDLVLGTANRTTIHCGEVDRAFVKYMEPRGYNIFLPAEYSVISGESDPFNAGHTTRWVAKQYGINAIQIETFSKFRKKEGQARGEKLAADMAEFICKHYAG